MRRSSRTVLTVLVAALLPASLAVRPAEATTPDREAEQWALERVDAQSAWLHATGEGAIVAVIDTGVDKDHPELQGKFVHGASWLDCPSGQLLPCHDPAAWDDRNGHGTHVAGIIAAPRDGVGVTGIAPDAKIMPLRVPTSTWDEQRDEWAAAIRYAVAHGADAINLSLAWTSLQRNAEGLTGLDGGLADALIHAHEAGVVVVMAAGNDGHTIWAPICANEFVRSAVVCVGATDRHDRLTTFSNYGVGLDLVAPGGAYQPRTDPCTESVLSTFLVEGGNPDWCEEPGYAYYSGTSMASPAVAGAVALMAEIGLHGDAALRKILDTADDTGVPGYDPHHAHGRLNVHRAVTESG